MRIGICVIVALALTVPLASCSNRRRVLNLENEPLPGTMDGGSRTTEEVRKAILRACSHRGWSARVQEEGVIVASIIVRTHTAKIKIHYTESTIGILYRDSSNLGYGRGWIHGKYNHWVATLHRTILRELGSEAQYY